MVHLSLKVHTQRGRGTKHDENLKVSSTPPLLTEMDILCDPEWNDFAESALPEKLQLSCFDFSALLCAASTKHHETPPRIWTRFAIQ